MSTTTIDYSQLTDEEALDILKTDFDSKEVESWEARNHIISPADVLYYCDAYGDLEDAILLQGFDKTLPVSAHKGLLKSGWDIFEAVNCNDLDTQHCPSCDTKMWEIQINEGVGYTSHQFIDEYGDTEEYSEFVSDIGGRFWNADPSESYAPMLCPGCSLDLWHDFPRELSSSGSVVVHYGETDEISAFGVCGNLIYWRFEDEASFRSPDPWTDLFGLPGDEEELGRAFAIGSKSEFFEKYDWAGIHYEDIQDAGSARIQIKSAWKIRDVVQEIGKEWAEGEETHPDLDFTYVIDFTNWRTPKFWTTTGNRDRLLEELSDLLESKL